MQITLKSLKGDLFQIDVEPSSLVKALKEHIQSTKDIVVDKLIHQGKILDDDKDLASYSIAEGAMVILMAKKTAPAAKPAAAPAPIPTPVQPTTPAAAPTQAAQSQATGTPASAPAPATQGGMVLGPELEATVQEMCSMGFPREQVLLAMRAAFNNAERAMQYLLDGIPENVLSAPAQGGAAHPGAAQHDQDIDVRDDADDVDAGGVAGGLTVEQLRQSVPGLDQALAAVRQQPELLQPLLAQLARTRPDIIQAIEQNQGAFLQLLAQGAGGEGGQGGAPGGGAATTQIQVTAEEHAAIRRLMDLGFPEAAAVEAYFTCDKDENLAANYLFENFGQ